MKKICLLLTVSMLAVSILSAQSPQSFKYQAIARDEAGNILSNWHIGIRINIIKGGQDGSIIYSEKHLISSSQYGMITLTIGEGQMESGKFDNIDWGDDRHYIKMEMDIDGNGDFMEMGTTQLYAVPYALYAEQAGEIRRGSSDSKTRTEQQYKTSNPNQKSSSKNRGSRNGTPNSKITADSDSWLNVNTGNVGLPKT